MITYPGVKINIGLNVLRKREDGYHDLETLFWPCREYSDVLEIVRADDFSETAESLRTKYLSCGDAEMALPIRQAVTEDAKLMMTIARAEGVDWAPEKDLCVRAYYLLLNDFPDLTSVKIFLEKRSPVGAGLGGGSADAAFALKMMNDMFSLGLSKDDLASYAARLGSDCAFFIYDEPMFGTGRGEQLSPYDSSILDGYHIKLTVPENVSVKTAEAYRGVIPHFPEVPLADALRNPVSSWRTLVHNDFEDSVFVSHPELASVKDDIYASGAVYASMSGSGSAFFGIYED